MKLNIFVRLALIFVIGGSLGWVIELFFRRWAHKKWVNPGFLVGPCLPLYGTGLVVLYLLCLPSYDFIADPVWRVVFVVAMLAVVMTLVEYITGLIFIKGMKVKLWDYSDRWGNIQGIICPLFSLFWAVICAVYYIFIHPLIASAGEWISSNPFFSFFVGMYFGVLVVAVCYSFHIVSKIKKWATEQNLTVRYENLKIAIRNRAEERKTKKHFLFPFRSASDFREELENYRQLMKEKIKAKKKQLIIICQ